MDKFVVFEFELLGDFDMVIFILNNLYFLRILFVFYFISYLFYINIFINYFEYVMDDFR